MEEVEGYKKILNKITFSTVLASLEWSLPRYVLCILNKPQYLKEIVTEVNR